MDLNAINASVNRLLTNIWAVMAFLKGFTTGDAKDVSITYVNQDGSESVKTFSNIAKILAEFESFRASIKAYSSNNWGSAYHVTRMLFYIGTTGDASKGYVLMARKYDGTNKLDKNGCQGKLIRSRGASYGSLIAYSVELTVMSAYDQVEINGRVTSGHCRISEVDFNGITYYAVSTNALSAHGVSFEGIVADPYGDGFPKIINDDDVSNVNDIKTLVAD